MEQQVDHYFMYNEKKHYDPRKVKALLNELNGESLRHLETAKPYQPRKIVDPFCRNPTVQKKLEEVKSFEDLEQA